MPRLLAGPWAWAALLLAFVIAAVVQTWPLVRHADSRLMEAPQQPGDSWVFLWDLWWVKHAVLGLTNPFHTDYLYYPQGTDLYLHALNFINGLLSIPLQLITGEVILSWSILSIVLLAVSGVGAFAVVRRLTRNNLAALFSGYAFAFAPPTLMHLQGGQWNLSSTWPIPLVVLSMLRFGETRRISDGALCAAAWSVLTYNWIEFGIDAALLLALFFLFSSTLDLRRGDRRALLRLWVGGAVIALVWLLLTSPLLIGGFASAYSDRVTLPTGGEFWSADLLAFVTPSPLWGPGVFADGAGGSHLQPGTILGTWYLGILPLVLSAAALLFWKRAPAAVLFWACAGLVFLVLSLGPALYVNGERQALSLFGLNLPLPYEVYDQLPVAGDRRIPARIAVFGIFAVAVLAGLGLDALMSHLRRRSGVIPPLIAAAALAFLVLEFWNPPVHLSPLAQTPAVRAIASEPGDFTVLSVPWGRATGHTAAGDSSGAYMTN